ncbi:hypothetical protein IAT40_005857 [Kwoniella sp. CBS 6097]
MATHERTPIASQRGDVDEKERDHTPVLTQNDLDGTPSAARYIPLRYRLVAFSMVIFFNTSSSFSESTLSPLKSTFREKLGVTSKCSFDTYLLLTIDAQYGAISSASSLVNTILPVLGGLGIDYWGATYTFIMIGAIISAAGSNTAHFGMLVGGRILMGFGSMARGKLTRRIPAFTTIANLAICVLYWYFERRVPEKYRPPLGKDAAKTEGALRKVIEFNNLPRFSNLADIQTQTRGTSKLAAGYNSSLQSVAPIVLIPLVGAFIDRFGMRMFFISWTAMMYVIVIGLIGLTKVHPLGPIILGSFALSTYALPFSASIPIIIGDPKLLGTAIGVWKAFGNGGIIVFDVAAGAIQDLSGNNSYNNVIYLLMAYKSLQILYGFFFDWLDGRWLSHSLRKSEKERTEIRDRTVAEGVVLPGWKPSRWGMIVVMGELAGLTVYIVYSLGT